MESNKKIKIVDSIMGSGKTSWAIQYMNENPDNPYIYITPYLEEVERLKHSCQSINMKDPQHKGIGKQDDFHNMLIKKETIASTHTLFRMSNKTTNELIRYGNYTLILDEVMDVIEELHIKPKDIEIMIKSELITIDEDGIITWDQTKEDYDTRYNDIKLMASNKTLIYHSNTVFIWNFPAEIFRSFKEVYILTYFFEGQIQKYYYDLYNIKYEYHTVIGEYGNYQLKKLESASECREYDNKRHLKTLINICKYEKINAIGDDYYALSFSWYDKKSKDAIKSLKNNMYNFLKNMNKTDADHRMWTTFKKARHKLKGSGYSNGFVPFNKRAVNKYRERDVIAYCVNVFMRPIIKSYLLDKDIVINEDAYALSEMLQWIWRSAIRDNKEINIYIPSKRMRELLEEYLES